MSCDVLKDPVAFYSNGSCDVIVKVAIGAGAVVLLGLIILLLRYCCFRRKIKRGVILEISLRRGYGIIGDPIPHVLSDAKQSAAALSARKSAMHLKSTSLGVAAAEAVEEGAQKTKAAEKALPPPGYNADCFVFSSVDVHGRRFAKLCIGDWVEYVTGNSRYDPLSREENVDALRETFDIRRDVHATYVRFSHRDKESEDHALNMSRFSKVRRRMSTRVAKWTMKKYSSADMAEEEEEEKEEEEEEEDVQVIHGSEVTLDIELPLYGGWKEAIDKEGRVYYYNRSANKTQRNRPTKTQMEATKTHRESKLWGGWEKTKDKKSQTYFFNKHTKKKQRDRPSEKQMDNDAKEFRRRQRSGGALELKNGWKEAYDEKKRKRYYYNRQLGKTTYKLTQREIDSTQI
eukprot:g527.t1